MELNRRLWDFLDVLLAVPEQEIAGRAQWKRQSRAQVFVIQEMLMIECDEEIYPRLPGIGQHAPKLRFSCFLLLMFRLPLSLPPGTRPG